MSVVIETTIGDITVDLYLKERPNTCLNFLKLCKIKYYNLCLFLKVERNFIAQSGDPTSTGRGGDSIFSHLYGDQAKYFDSELKPKLKHEKIGTLSMVNNGSNMNGSQFFLTLGENLTYLDEVHTVFGEVVEGFEILLKINESICDSNNRPYQDIRITHTVVLHDPYDDPSGLNIPDASPIPTKEMLETDYIAPDEEIDDTKGKNTEEIEEKIKESEAKARATILEMVGDIPDADVKPPENVLFVCKLNPVTTSEDLELIFSRFGTIVSCEVIKDKKSGESLQYAFIEFEKEEDCENAYFKMDNVLIDDRRIHVDFSQSVSKLNWNPDDRFSKQKSNRGQTYTIKDKQRKSDGYEMIFDMNVESSHFKNKKNKSKSDSQSSKRRKHSNSPDNRRSHPYISHNKEKRSVYVKSPSPVRSFKRGENRKSRSPNRQEYFAKSSSYKNVKESKRHDSSSSDSSSSSINRKKIEYYSKSSNYNISRRYNSENSHSVSKDKNRNPSSSYSKNKHDSKHSSRVLSKSVRKKTVTSSSESGSMSPDIQYEKDKKVSNYSTTSKSHGSSYHHDKHSSRVHSKSSVASYHRSKSSSNSESDNQSKNKKRKEYSFSSTSKIHSSNYSSIVNSKFSIASHHRSKSSSSLESVDETKNEKRKDSNNSSSSKIYSSKLEKHSSRVHSKSSATSHNRNKSSSSSESVSPERYHKKKHVKSSKPSLSYKKSRDQSLSPEYSKISHSHKNFKHKEKYTNSYSNESDDESYYTNKKLNSSKSFSSKHYHKR